MDAKWAVESKDPAWGNYHMLNFLRWGSVMEWHKGGRGLGSSYLFSIWLSFISLYGSRFVFLFLFFLFPHYLALFLAKTLG